MKEFEDLAGSASNPESLMERVAQRIHMHIPRYNWVGFYLIDKQDSGKLVLGPHTGSFTSSPTLSRNQGLCGAAATFGRVIIADNVAEDPRYLRSSDLVKSQISAPIVRGGKTVGVLNIESYFLATFRKAEERQFVENCAKVVGRCFEKTVVRDLVNV